MFLIKGGAISTSASTIFQKYAADFEISMLTFAGKMINNPSSPSNRLEMTFCPLKC